MADIDIDFTQGTWLNPPQNGYVSKETVAITTEPGTDLWQRSYYGFQNDNAPAIQIEYRHNFSFSTRVDFHYQAQFDQCGVIIYLDSANWFKASIEYENPRYSRLGSVVTNHGHSDWASTNLPTPTYYYYRLQRRGPDFLLESSVDGEHFQQMRVFHLHLLGETSQQMGKSQPPLPAQQAIRFGLYACSPADSSFTARFSEYRLMDCLWKAHEAT